MSSRASASALIDLIDAYCAAWNDPDGVTRAAALRTLLKDDGLYADPNTMTRGVDALSDHIGQVQAGRPGALVARSSAIDHHHDFARFRFEVRHADDQVVLEGTDIIEVDRADGRIVSIIGFFGSGPE